ncbi:MAG: hypothetical protein MUC54_05675 [Chloroflexi bacterium]|jgi:hypothetical protein|nr:hypothetical protein [Chloroflexota bacterium]
MGVPGAPGESDDGGQEAGQGAEAIEFVRFCRGRRRVGWPELYDEMILVACRGHFHGYGFEELTRCGIGFTLAELPRLAALVARVVAEERAPVEIGKARRGSAVLGAKEIGHEDPARAIVTDREATALFMGSPAELSAPVPG